MSQIVLTNTGNVPTVTAQGEPADLDINITPKGAGRVNIPAGLNVTSPTTLVGVTDGSTALAGQVGEYASTLVPVGTPVSLTNDTGANVVSLSLTAGDWDVAGSINYIETGTTATILVAGITSTSATVPVDGSEVYNSGLGTTLTETSGTTLARKRFNLTATTAIKLAAKATFSAGTVTAFGTLTARRVR